MSSSRYEGGEPNTHYRNNEFQINTNRHQGDYNLDTDDIILDDDDLIPDLDDIEREKRREQKKLLKEQRRQESKRARREQKRESKRVPKRNPRRQEQHGQEPQNKQSASKNGTALSDLFLLFFKILLIALFIFILFTFVFGITQVKDNSMAPAIREGDLVIYYRFQKDYAAQSVIALSVDGETEIRRVIGVAGDKINITDQGLEINSYPQIESSIYTDTLPYVDGITFPVTLSDNQVFVLGDNRTEAKDSRMYGAVNKNATLGTVVTVIRRRGF